MKCLFFFLLFAVATALGNPKIVGVMQLCNEEQIAEQSLRCLAEYCDALVVLNDGSVDRTAEILEILAPELRIEKIITHEVSYWKTKSEIDNRNELLMGARSVGATHIMWLDADEFVTATCKKDNWLRNKILNLPVGATIFMQMIDIWGDCHHYRDDGQLNPHMDINTTPIAFADDGKSRYSHSYAPSGAIHVCKTPFRSSQDVVVKDINYGLLHFKSVNLNDRDLKRCWYMCLEFLRCGGNQHRARSITDFYNRNVMIVPAHVGRSRVPDSWLDYSFFNESCFSRNHSGRINDFTKWFNTYGVDYFRAVLNQNDVNFIMNQISR